MPTFKEHADLIRKGVSLHDKGDYDGAIRAYRRVLDDNPDDVNALYELGFSYFLNHDHANCILSATRGAAYQSMLQTEFQRLLGNCLDASGEPEKALRAFHSALEDNPTDHLLHYNLAITYQNLDNREKAIRHFKEAIKGNPNHASSHLGLSELYFAERYRIPALLASARFLILEPNSARTAFAMQTLHATLGAQTHQRDNKEIRIFMDPEARTDEGDFHQVRLFLSLDGVAALSDGRKDQTPLETTLRRLGRLFSFLGKVGGTAEGQQRSGFAWNHYVPYFGQLEERGFVEPFVHYTHQMVAWDGVDEWIDVNGERINDFLDWSLGYRDWPQASGVEQ